MATTLIKDKLSKLVLSQLPEFIQSDYNTFTAFLEAYYRFLEQDQSSQELLQNIFSYNDIDRTIDSFIQYFRKYYIPDIPESNLVDKRFLLKNIKDLYSNKGNEKSYELLLRLLFNKQVNFYYPGKSILIASDGKWNQDTSIFVKVLVGDPDSIIQKNVDIVSGETISGTTLIRKKINVPISVGQSVVESTDTFEYYIDNSGDIKVQIGDFVEFTNFKGVIVATTTSVTVVDGGVGFKIGQVFSLTSGSGDRSIIRIKGVSSTGAITQVEFIQYGINYESTFLASLTPTTEEITPNIFLISGGTFFISDSTNGFIDSGDLNTYNYALTGNELYVNPTYAGALLRTFYYDSRETADVEVSAVLQINLGAKAKYPGYFRNNDGFLSDDVYLQDRDFYQPYSYVLKIDEQLKNYKKAVLDILHPAGLKLFGEYEINEIRTFTPNVATTVSVT